MHFLTYPQHPKARTFISFTLIALMLLSVGVAAAIPKSTTASYVDVLTNGGFEHGFVSQPGCGMVGYGWHCFTNGGAANYGFYDDQWQPVVAEGSHSQLIEINTKGIIDGDPDRYAGLYQTVRVVDWENYQLNLRGMIRTTNPDGDPYRYQVQVGWTAGAHADWQAVTNWQDTGWYTYYDRLEPGAFSDYSTHIMAEDDYITVYVRVWKKWPVFDEEIDINLDAISLTGPSPIIMAGARAAVRMWSSSTAGRAAVAQAMAVVRVWSSSTAAGRAIRSIRLRQSILKSAARSTSTTAALSTASTRSIWAMWARAGASSPTAAMRATASMTSSGIRWSLRASTGS